MLHSHALTPAPRKPFLPRIPDAHPLTPGGYLQLRRKAAGLDIRDLAKRLTDLRNAQIEARELPAGMLGMGVRPRLRLPLGRRVLHRRHDRQAARAVAQRP
nr:hypothetical protein [uncultured Sphingomonas sp.]